MKATKKMKEMNVIIYFILSFSIFYNFIRPPVEVFVHKRREFFVFSFPQRVL